MVMVCAPLRALRLLPGGEMPGYVLARFAAGEVPAHLVCAVCDCVLIEPRAQDGCAHLYCEPYIRAYVGNDEGTERQ
ncbi:hypothetical protein T492DRAFT_865945 [Pavlovales sp. CCMP2436]|nr:hypothetical protein T492DRAFT_865945 [Pavlovales sp. CCMP2436]